MESPVGQETKTRLHAHVLISLNYVRNVSFALSVMGAPVQVSEQFAHGLLTRSSHALPRQQQVYPELTLTTFKHMLLAKQHYIKQYKQS